MEKQDWPVHMNTLGESQYIEERILQDLQIASTFDQDLGEAESCASSTLDRSCVVDMTNQVGWFPGRQQYDKPSNNSEKPSESHVISENLKGLSLQGINITYL